MRFFHHYRDLSQAAVRKVLPGDFPRIGQLFRTSAYRFFGLPGQDLATLLASAPALLITNGDEIWAVIIGGWPIETSIWLRGMGIVSGLPPPDAVNLLLPPFHTLLRSRGVRSVFYSGSESSDRWLQPILRQHGYTHYTDVVVYEKRDLQVPTAGNQSIRVRRAEPVDLPHLLAIDRSCFAPQWNKDEGIIGPALVNSPHFIVAEIDGRITGYAFITQHFEGRLIHLVRIAVLPAYQGQSIGSRLLSEVIDYSRQVGATTLTLNTQADNTSAQRLYEWFGFRRTGEQQMVMGFTIE